MKPQAPSIIIPRRSFIKSLGCTGMSTWALSSTIRDLRLINAVMAQTNVGSDYKALVCLFLNGGNDANNWIVPTDNSTYEEYAAIRQNLTLPESSLLNLKQTGAPSDDYVDSDGHTYGFHPGCADLQTLFGEGKLAPLFNVGTLVRPTTRAQYTSSNAAFYQPPQLFSHSDQITQWQTSIPDAPPQTGWGGRVADILNSAANPSGNISMSVSVAGANTFEVGNVVSQYNVSTSGAETVGGVTGPRLRALTNLVALSHANLQRSAIAAVTQNAIKAGDLLNNSIDATKEVSAGGSWVWNTPFPTSSLGQQMKMIARIIQARGPFNLNRQVFFCTTGGFDTHTTQVSVNNVDDPANPAGVHYGLLNDVSKCMFAFQRAMEQLGVSNKVTTFTASDFSRTLPTNSQGSDHGWGSHHLIMGGAVNGGQTYGKLPTFAINGPDDTGLGRWIPTLAVDQYSATLAKWFGVDNSNMATVFPNLSRFATSDLGFMT